jgi:hypothetical protein
MRKFLAFAAVAALSALSAPLIAQNPAGGAAPAQRRMTQGGSGPIRMLLITKAHAYEREPYYQMFDSMGADITWMHVDHPAAEAFMTPKYANRYDVAFFYDMNGAQADLGRSRREPAPDNPFYPNGTKLVVNPPSAELQRGFPALLQQGKGMVFTHHSLASWPHSWPEYIEVMGGACDWGNSISTRGVQHPNSGFFPMTPQRITVVNKTHPITQGQSEPELEVQQPRRVGEERGEQPRRVHPDGSWSRGLGQRVVSQARAERYQVGRVARSARVGEGKSEAHFQIVDELGDW